MQSINSETELLKNKFFTVTSDYMLSGQHTLKTARNERFGGAFLDQVGQRAQAFLGGRAFWV